MGQCRESFTLCLIRALHKYVTAVWGELHFVYNSDPTSMMELNHLESVSNFFSLCPGNIYCPSTLSLILSVTVLLFFCSPPPPSSSYTVWKRPFGPTYSHQPTCPMYTLAHIRLNLENSWEISLSLFYCKNLSSKKGYQVLCIMPQSTLHRSG